MQGWIKQKKLMQTTTEHTIEWQKKQKKKNHVVPGDVWHKWIACKWHFVAHVMFLLNKNSNFLATGRIMIQVLG